MSHQIETRCIHGNSDFSYQEVTKAVSFPIYQTATFGHIGLGRSTGFDYSNWKRQSHLLVLDWGNSKIFLKTLLTSRIDGAIILPA